MKVRDSAPRARQRELEGLSPFELRNRLIALADENTMRSAAAMLNAGRGNPNWVATTPREAFFLLGKFGMAESRRAWDEWDGLGGMPAKKGIAERAAAFLSANRHEAGASLLRAAIEYGTSELGFNADAFVHELADGVVGDNYPIPDRMPPHVEQVVHRYLVKEMCGGRNPARPFDLFATEGAAAAMCYVLDSLTMNKILRRGDRIAVMVPVSAPYLQIPRLDRYDFKITEIRASMVDSDGFRTWQYEDSELAKLGNSDIKALCLINPSNPPSVMMSLESVNKLVEVVRKKNPRLAIVTDDVYGTFVEGYRSLMSALPRNTIGVYSFSKFFGCSGWRLGVVAVNRDNIFDEKIAGLKSAEKKELAKRYEPLTAEPGKLRFVDRMAADSRQVALGHTAGLSLPQQVQMAMFALSDLLDTDSKYRSTCQAIIESRAQALTKGMLVPLPRNQNAANYYVEIDLLSWMERLWGKEFSDYMRKNFEPVDVLFRVAEQHSVVLPDGSAFNGNEWSVRVSTANLPTEAYEQIGEWLTDAVKEYKAEFDETRGGG